MLVDDYLTVYDVSDAVATVVNADVARTWSVLMEDALVVRALYHDRTLSTGTMRTATTDEGARVSGLLDVTRENPEGAQ